MFKVLILPFILLTVEGIIVLKIGSKQVSNQNKVKLTFPQFSLPLKGFNLCLSFSPRGKKDIPYLFYNPSFYCHINPDGGISAIGYKFGEDVTGIKFKIPGDIIFPLEWNSFCYRNAEDLNQIIINGHLVANSTKKLLFDEVDKISTYEFGKSRNAVGGTEIWITNFNIWSDSTSVGELKELSTSCQENFENEMPIMQWDSFTTLNFQGAGPNVKVIEKPLEDTCNLHHLVLFSEGLPFETSFQACLGLSGQMYLPQNTTDLIELRKKISLTRIWVPIVAEKGEWASYSFDNMSKPQPFLPWNQNEPDGNELEKCVLFEGEEGYSDVNCERKEAFVCSFKSVKIFTLRGFPLIGNKGHHFFINHELSFNDKIVFEGLDHRFIIYDSNRTSWVIYDDSVLPKGQLDEKRIVAKNSNEADKDGLPIGLEMWQLSVGGYNSSFLMKFTQVFQFIFTSNLFNDSFI